MVKEPTNNATFTKKRKSAETEGDIYKVAVDAEEKEALQRSPDKDANLYFEICGNIRKLLGDILELKSEKSDDSKNKVAQNRTEACVMTALLKKLNRLEKVRTISARDKLNLEKSKADSINLQYHNLLYEKEHLISEYNKCKRFKSKDEGISLVSVDTFLKEGPAAVTKKFISKDLEDTTVRHELHLAMLEYELSQRIELAKLCDTMETEKKQLAKDIVLKKERLEGLGPRLAAVLEATKPLQEQLGLPIDKIRGEHKLASLLPDSLYLLYCNGDAYKQVNDLGLSIEIVGDQEEALQYNELQNTLNDIESDVEVEPQEEASEGSKKRRHRKASVIDKMEEKKKKLLEPHPLSIQISMEIKGGPTLKIKLFHRTNLKIVSVYSSVEITSGLSGNSAREVLQGESLLNELFDADFGKESPNPSNEYQLKKINLGTYESLIPKIGFAYIWAQKICGHDLLNFNDKSNKIGHANIEIVFKALHKRLKARFALAEQLQQLELNCIINIPESVEYPKSAISTLTKWGGINYQKFCSDTPNALSLVEMGVASPNDLFYTITIARPKATLQASVIIKNDYPFTTPFFIIYTKSNSEVLHAANSDDIRDMERAVNIGWDQSMSCAGWLLSVQVRYICSFFDVYLETKDTSGFNQSTVFFKNVCARNRRRPYKFRKIGAGIFTQY